MDALLKPDVGLMVWTIVTFIVLLVVLGRFVWRPILGALEKRESGLRDLLDRTEKSQKDAEALRLQYETRLAEAQKSVQDMLNKAKAEGERSKTRILEDAKKESDKIVERGRMELGQEAEKLKVELRREVAGISVAIAEKILKKSVDNKVKDESVKEYLTQIGGARL